MNKSYIKIPCVQREERIGSVFNYLFNVISQSETANGEVVWDFCDAVFFHPFFLAPLAIYRKNCGKNISCTNICYQLRNYLNLICFDDMNLVSDNLRLGDVLGGYSGKSYIPICDFRLDKWDDADAMQSVIQNVIERQSGANKKMRDPLSYLLSEIVCNIKQHSYANSGYIFSQYIKRENCINLCIADNGISIYGSYIRANRYVDKIGDNEAMALKMANEGYSTKDLPNAENRGYGISTSKRMLVDGLKGSFFMLSGSAFHRHDANGIAFARLPKHIRWNGTIVLMKIPVDVPDEFRYYDYIE